MNHAFLHSEGTALHSSTQKPGVLKPGLQVLFRRASETKECAWNPTAVSPSTRTQIGIMTTRHFFKFSACGAQRREQRERYL